MKRGFLVISLFFVIFLSLNIISAAWTEDLNVNLLHYWNFNETATPLKDAYGNLDLVAGGTPTYNQTGITGGSAGAIYLDATSDYFNNNTGIALSDMQFGTTQNVSFSFWIKTNSTSEDHVVIKTKDGSFAVSTGNHTSVSATGTTGSQTNIWSDSDRSFVWIQDNIRTGNWSHLVYIRQVINATDSNFTIFLNDTLKDTVIAPSRNYSTTSFYIGSEFASLPSLVFYMDELAFWNRTLTRAEVTQLYNNGSGITFSQPSQPLNSTTFENVFVNNNLTVVNNISASKGFFTNLGSSISRIIKGWFTDIDVSGTANLTGNTYLLNSTCSTNQVLTTDSNGLVSCTADQTGSNDIIFNGRSSASLTADASGNPNGGVMSASADPSMSATIPFVGKIHNLTITMSAAQGVGDTCRIAIKKASTPTGTYTFTNLNATIIDTAQTATNSTYSASVNSGDSLQVFFDEVGGTCSGFVGWTFVFTRD